MRLTDDLVRDLLDDLGLSLEPNEVAAEIAPVAHALSTRAPRRSIEQKAAHAADAVWSDDLRSELAVQLAGLPGDAVARLAIIDAAVEELDKPAARNRVALALVYESAATLLSAPTETTSSRRLSRSGWRERPSTSTGHSLCRSPPPGFLPLVSKATRRQLASSRASRPSGQSCPRLPTRLRIGSRAVSPRTSEGRRCARRSVRSPIRLLRSFRGSRRR